MRAGSGIVGVVVAVSGAAWADVPPENCAEIWRLTESAKAQAYAIGNAFHDDTKNLFGDKESRSLPEAVAAGSAAFVAIGTVNLWEGFIEELLKICPEPDD